MPSCLENMSTVLTVFWCLPSSFLFHLQTPFISFTNCQLSRLISTLFSGRFQMNNSHLQGSENYQQIPWPINCVEDNFLPHVWGPAIRRNKNPVINTGCNFRQGCIESMRWRVYKSVKSFPTKSWVYRSNINQDKRPNSRVKVLRYSTFLFIL